MSDWITDRYPPIGERVLVSGKISIYIAVWDGMAWYKVNGHSTGHYCQPTAWMPLPDKYEGWRD